MTTIGYEISTRPAPPPPGPPPVAPPPDAFARWRTAFPAMDAWREAGATPASTLRRLGLSLWSAGRLGEASAALADAAAADPRDGAIWLDLGFCLRASGDLPGALQAFERAVALKPEASVYLALGMAAKQVGDRARCARALKAALKRDAGLDDAAYSLALLHFEDRRYEEAAQLWRPLVARGYRTGAIRVGLGQCLFFLGDFAGAADALAAHLSENPPDEALQRRRAFAAFLDGALRGGVEGARAAYSEAAGEGAEPVERIARAGFLLLAGYGHTEAALTLARVFANPDDPIDRHHVAALAGDGRAKAPEDYVAAYFDRFASNFDVQMKALGYKVPEKLVALIDEAGVKPRRALDLGCGSGGAAAWLRPRCEWLAGVDLSPNMVAKARERGRYDELQVGDMVERLTGAEAAFDLVFAADSLIYLGDLKPLLEAAAAAIAPGGALALTVETGARAPFALQTSGRFAHSPKALVADAAPWFERVACRRAFLRREGSRNIYGALMLLRRRGPAIPAASSP